MASRILQGISWSAIQQFSTQAIQFIVTIVLARILTPAQFGVVAVSTILLNIMQTINESGFGVALLQKLDRDEKDFYCVFVLNILLGIFLYILVFISAPLWAIIFKTPDVIPVVRLIGINLIINSFSVVQRTKLLIKVDFKQWTKATIISAFFSGILGIYLAYKGYGVYSLVFQSISMSFISNIIICFIVNWKPKKNLSLSRIKNLFKFAYKLILARLVNTIYNEVNSSIIGIFFTPSQLAFFNRAMSFESISTNNIVSIIQRVSVPLMCEVQNSESQLRKILLKFIEHTALIITPLIVILYTLSDPLIIILLTEKWIESAYILKILCFTGFFYNLSSFNMNLYNATGRTDLALKCELTKKLVSISIIVFALIFHNFYILVWTFLLISIFECILNIKFTYQLVHIKFLSELWSLRKIIICGIITGGFISLLSKLNSNIYIQLFVFGSIGLIIYFSLIYLFNICNLKARLQKLILNH